MVACSFSTSMTASMLARVVSRAFTAAASSRFTRGQPTRFGVDTRSRWFCGGWLSGVPTVESEPSGEQCRGCPQRGHPERGPRSDLTLWVLLHNQLPGAIRKIADDAGPDVVEDERKNQQERDQHTQHGDGAAQQKCEAGRQQ